MRGLRAGRRMSRNKIIRDMFCPWSVTFVAQYQGHVAFFDATSYKKADLQRVLIIPYHKDARQVLKSTIKKPELVTLYENCGNAYVVLPPGAAGKTEATLEGAMDEEEEPTLNNPPNFDSSIDL
jgi:hypothetical protein